MHRIIATTLAILMLGAPIVGAATADDDVTNTDTDTVIVPPGHVAVADVAITEDGVDLELSTVAEDALAPTALQAEEAERPNCLHGGDGWAPVGSSALSVAGEDLAPLVDAGAADECAPASFEDGFDSAAFITSADGDSRVMATWSMGFIFNTFVIDCEGTAASVGPTDDAHAVECESQINGVHTSDWSGWDADIYREDASGASYATFATG